MAQLPDDEVNEIIQRSKRRKFTPRTITEPQEIWDKIHEARENGFALASEEVLQGEIAIGAAIRGPEGRPVAAIHVGGSLSEWNKETFSSHFAPLIMAAAGTINRQ